MWRHNDWLFPGVFIDVFLSQWHVAASSTAKANTHGANNGFDHGAVPGQHENGHYAGLLLLISMLWHRQAIFESKGDNLSSSAECRIRTQGLRHLFASRLNACWQTDWAIEDQAIKLELDSPSLWWASIQPTRPHCQLAFAPGSGDIHVCCC